MIYITPVDVTPSSTGWQDVDVSSHVSADATGVILRIKNDAGVTRYMGWRKNGSTDNRTDRVQDENMFWAGIGVDGSQILEISLDIVANVEIMLIGYWEDDANFFTNATDKSFTSTGWADIDISGDTGTDTAIAAVFEVDQSMSSNDWNFRVNGSTDNRYTSGAAYHKAAIAGCDGSEICEGYVNSTYVDFFLVGYLIDNATFITNATDISVDPADTGSWEDSDQLAAGATGAFIEIFGGGYDCGLRKNGSSDTTLGTPRYLAYGTVEADANRYFETYQQDAYTNSIWLQGYSTGGGGGPTPVDTEKTLAYAVKSDHDVTKTLAYEILTGHDITKALAYIIRKPIDVTKALAYEVKSEHDITKGMAYEVKSQVDINKGLAYAVITTPSEIEKALAYLIKTVTDIEKALDYEVKVSIGIEKTLAYKIKSPIDITKSLDYLVRVVNEISKGLDYRIITTTYKASYDDDFFYDDIRLSYDGYADNLEKALIYTVESKQSKSLDLEYAVKIPIDINRALDYDVAIGHDIEKGLEYQVEVEKEITKDIEYRLKIRRGIEKACGYAIKKESDITKSFGYAIIESKQKQRELNYSVQIQIEIQKNLTYVIKVEREVEKSLDYLVIASYEITKGLEYVVPAKIVITKAIHYAIVRQVGIVKSLEYIMQIDPYCDKDSPYSTKDGYGAKDSPYSKFPNKC